MRKRPIDFENSLNPEQLAAVSHGEGPQLVLAGAGSGKTRVITYRIAWLVRELGIDPYQISAVTFTNKAAGEMRERVEDLLALHPLPASVGTFHRFSLGLLRAYGDRLDLPRGFAIFDAQDQQGLVKKALAAEKLDPSSFPPRSVLAAISSAKNRLLDPEQYEREAEGFFRVRVAKVYHRYQKLLREAGGVDFDDMIQLAVQLLRSENQIKERIRERTLYLLVDEFQDTNHAQLCLVRELAGDSGNLTAVGDEDQSIYSWRGAEIENILRFEQQFPGAEVRKLERNYRSTQNILDAAGAVVANNRGRRGKRLWTESGAGSPIVLYRARDELDEARWIVRVLQEMEMEMALSEMAILVRTNAQTRALEDELLRAKMPYTLVGGLRFYERAEIKDLIAYLRLLRNPRDSFSLARILNRPARGIGRGTQDKFLDRASEQGRSAWELLLADDLDGLPTRGTKALRSFREMIRGLAQDAEELPLRPLLARLLEVTGYADLYDPKEPEGQAKLENIQEFLSAAQEFTEAYGYAGQEEDLLSAFLDHASLTADLDGWNTERGVAMMTLHSAKGLEFKGVALAGLEDGLLPHFNASVSDDSVEEERRLLYVGMTRAEQRLHLTSCDRRRIAGRYQDQRPSPFLAEIPHQLLEIEESPELGRPDQAAAIYGYFGRGGSNTSSSGRSRPPRAATTASRSRPSTASSGGLRKGSHVRHSSLGRGVVLDLEGSGDDTRLTVLFDSAGKRKLIARYASLEIL